MKKYLKLLYHTLLKIKFYYIAQKMKKINIATIEETVEYLLQNRKSISRFGDGEFKWIEGIAQESFQESSKALSRRLKEVINSQSSNLLVCLPDAFRIDFLSLKENSKNFWILEIAKYGSKYLKYLDNNYKYFNTSITRFYIDYNDYELAKERFMLVSKLWKNREVLIVEGEYSRLGFGNDLFNDCNHISRIIVPAENAFSVYDNILEKVIENSNVDTLILLAIGPTATVLAYDLSQHNRQALDIGHIDIEYEWFLAKSDKKIPVKNKYTNEAKNLGGTEISDCKNQQYITEIIATIKRNGM